MKCVKTMTKLVAPAVLLLALAFSSAAVGKSDGFFNNADGVHTSNGGATWFGFVDGDSPSGGGATWQGFDNGDVSLGGGLLVLALSGVCYAGAKRVKGLKD